MDCQVDFSQSLSPATSINEFKDKVTMTEGTEVLQGLNKMDYYPQDEFGYNCA